MNVSGLDQDQQLGYNVNHFLSTLSIASCDLMVTSSIRFVLHHVQV